MGADVNKVTYELITLARRFGEPAVVWAGPGAEEAQERCAEFGAARIYAAGDARFDEYVVEPAAELLAQLVRDSSPALVLVAGTAEGKEIAARLAIKTDSGLLTDAVDLTPGEDGSPVAGSSRSSAGRPWSTPGSAGGRPSSRCARTRLRPSQRPVRPSFRRCP